MAPTIPATELRRLRRLADDYTLEVLFDAWEAERSGKPCWNIYFRQGPHLELLGEWRHQLDGNIGVLASMIRSANYSVRSAKDQNAANDRRVMEKKKRAMQLRNDMIEDATDYSLNAWKAFIDGKASCGYTGAGCTGKA
jgi:hypothetical protein